MAKTRLELHEFLADILGSRNVYFQPPPSVTMKYPAIVYNLNRIQKIHADNDQYLKYKSYTVTVIDRDPESVTAAKLEDVPMCSFDRHFTSENLNHFVYTLYY